MIGEGGFGGFGGASLPVGVRAGGGSVGCGCAIATLVIVLLLCAAFAAVMYWGLRDFLQA